MKIIRFYTAGKNRALNTAFDRFASYLTDKHGTQFTFEVISALDNPQAAAQDNVFATPTIVKTFAPIKRVIGDISDAARVAKLLGL